MSGSDASELLRAGLLEGSSIFIAGSRAPVAGARPPGSGGGSRSTEGPDGSFAEAIEASCTALGARVSLRGLLGDGAPGLDEAATDELVDRVLDQTGGIDLLAVDCAGLFTTATERASESATGARVEGDVARGALGVCLQVSWNVTRALANRAFLERERGGRIVYLAPAAAAHLAPAAAPAVAAEDDAGERSEIVPVQHADAARAGLENLSRTLSIEWARYGITSVTIAPGAGTSNAEIAALTAYLASPAGAYFSGCLLDLRGPGGS
jgi:NAD(P)-dependent dehydrogenase (short-subunit alcohol dehydrogenase family)